jgi:hypothetical protein
MEPESLDQSMERTRRPHTSADTPATRSATSERGGC